MKTAVRRSARKYNPLKKTQIIHAVNGSVRSSILINSVLNITGLPLVFLAENVFEVTPKTLSRYRSEDVKLPAAVIELSLKIKDMYNLGKEIFGTNEELNKWLNEKSYGLNNTVPAKLLNTSSGIDLVHEELTRIAYGTTA